MFQSDIQDLYLVWTNHFLSIGLSNLSVVWESLGVSSDSFEEVCVDQNFWASLLRPPTWPRIKRLKMEEWMHITLNVVGLGLALKGKNKPIKLYLQKYTFCFITGNKKVNAFKRFFITTLNSLLEIISGMLVSVWIYLSSHRIGSDQRSQWKNRIRSVVKKMWSGLV